MNILHISDLHYIDSKGYKRRQEEVVKAICKEYKEQKIDFIFFTGDLVDRGNERFDEAYQLLIEPLVSSLNIPKHNIFFCEGNHDLKRDNEMSSIRLMFDEIKDNEVLNEFVEEGGREFEESLENHKGYFSFINQYFEDTEDDINPLYTCHFRSINSKKVGIVSINTSWRSYDSKIDSGKLIFPTVILEDLVEKVKGTDVKILLLHHPVSDLNWFNQKDIENLIYDNFDLMFSGHVHNRKLGTYLGSDNGIFSSVASCSLSEGANTDLGFTYIELDANSMELNVYDKIYVASHKKFNKANTFNIVIPQDEKKAKQNKLRRTINRRFIEELESSNDLLLIKEDGELTFLDLFVKPVIKTYPSSDLRSQKKDKGIIEYMDIINNDYSYLFFGKDKVGKTSLLRKYQLEFLGSYSDKKILPLFVDCGSIKDSEVKQDYLFKKFKRYYEFTRTDAENFLDENRLVLLVDNYSLERMNLNRELEFFFKKYENVSFLATSVETVSREYESINIEGREHSNLFIYPVTRTEVRALTKIWPGVPKENVGLIVDKIGKIFKQLNIPMNYWAVSLFLWVYQKNSSVSLHNNFDLIDLYIDGVLEKESFALGRSSKITFDDFKVFLGELSYYLITNGLDNESYSVEYDSLVGFVKKYRDKDSRFVLDIEEAINMLKQKGVIKGVEGKYTFRLNGVFEYFLAYFMKDNSDFRKEVIVEDDFYLSFANELELCSGFLRRDENLLKDVLDRTIGIYSPITRKYETEGNVDSRLKNRMKSGSELDLSLNKIGDEILKLSEEEQDNLLAEYSALDIQEAEVKRKKYYEEIIANPENLEKALFILCRVFRNSNVRDSDLNSKALDFILDSACNLGFLLVDEVGVAAISEEENDGKLLMKLMTTFMPTIVHTFLFDFLGQNNLQRLLEDKLENLGGQEEYKKILICVLLADLDLKENYIFIEKAIGFVSLPGLKQSLLLKLYYSLAFSNNTSLDAKISKSIREMNYKIDKKYDVDELNSRIENVKRLKLMRKNKEL